MSLRNYADKRATAEEKHNVSNVAINTFLPRSYLFTQRSREKNWCSDYAGVCTKDRDLFLVYHNI